MRKYYNQRMGLLSDELEVDIEQLLEFFYSTYKYFVNKGYFEYAITGLWEKDYYGKNIRQIDSPTFSPSAKVYFVNTLQSIEIWPIAEFYENYSEEQLFTVIEILYDHIAEYDYDAKMIKSEEIKKEYIFHINNILKLYGKGYYLEPTNGFIMEQPNEVLKKQLLYKGKEVPDNIYNQLQVATKMYYRFNSDFEERKKAINILADVLEGFRNDLKDIFNDELNINKNDHDSLIFQTVNKYNIRHNDESQVKEYSKEIWYDWMMQYFTTTIITYHKLVDVNK